MKVKYIKYNSGVAAGTSVNLRDSLAQYLISEGIVEAVSIKEVKVEQKEVKVELDTKEFKPTSKRKTKSKK